MPIKRNKLGQFTKARQETKFWNGYKKIVLLLTLITAIYIVAHSEYKEYAQPVTYVRVAEAKEEIEEEEVIQIKIEYSEERIKELIHETFPDAPIMERVAWCESHLNPDAFNPINNSNDRGLFQISDKYHKKTWQSLGYTDMHDVKQNLEYARYLYDKRGLQPWSASRHCWS